MFPHTITVINLFNGIYKKCYVDKVFFNNSKIVAPENKGENYSNVHQVIFSKASLEKYRNKKEYKGDNNTFTLSENDIIIKGLYKGNFYKMNDLDNIKNDYFRIKGIHENDYAINDYIENIEVHD